MDIAARKPTERTINIIDPFNGDDLFIQVSIMSLADERMKKVKRSIEDRRLYLEARGKAFKADEIEENRNNVTFSTMTGWAWGKNKDGEQVTFHGEVPDFNRKNVYAVFNELSWFRDQIGEALGEEKDFFVSSKST